MNYLTLKEIATLTGINQNTLKQRCEAHLRNKKIGMKCKKIGSKNRAFWLSTMLEVKRYEDKVKASKKPQILTN